MLRPIHNPQVHRPLNLVPFDHILPLQFSHPGLKRLIAHLVERKHPGSNHPQRSPFPPFVISSQDQTKKQQPSLHRQTAHALRFHAVSLKGPVKSIAHL
jgi:hypothetical protein